MNNKYSTYVEQTIAVIIKNSKAKPFNSLKNDLQHKKNTINYVISDLFGLVVKQGHFSIVKISIE
jgi:hypothetical protein